MKRWLLCRGAQLEGSQWLWMWDKSMAWGSEGHKGTSVGVEGEMQTKHWEWQRCCIVKDKTWENENPLHSVSSCSVRFPRGLVYPRHWLGQINHLCCGICVTAYYKLHWLWWVREGGWWERILCTGDISARLLGCLWWLSLKKLGMQPLAKVFTLLHLLIYLLPGIKMDFYFKCMKVEIIKAD